MESLTGQKLEPETSRREAIIADFGVTGSQALTARNFGLSRERVRQIVTAAGDARHDGRCRAPKAYRQAIAVLAAREGVTPTARLSGVSVANLRAWIGEFVGPTSFPFVGRPTLEVAAARDFRIRAALSAIRSA